MIENRKGTPVDIEILERLIKETVKVNKEQYNPGVKEGEDLMHAFRILADKPAFEEHIPLMKKKAEKVVEDWIANISNNKLVRNQIGIV